MHGFGGRAVHQAPDLRQHPARDRVRQRERLRGALRPELHGSAPGGVHREHRGRHGGVCAGVRRLGVHRLPEQRRHSRGVRHGEGTARQQRSVRIPSAVPERILRHRPQLGVRHVRGGPSVRRVVRGATTCGPGLTCTGDTQECVALAASGASCGKGAPCGSGLVCIGADDAKNVMGKCDMGIAQSGTACDPTLAKGPGCSRDAGLTCNSASKTCQNIVVANAGSPCGEVMRTRPRIAARLPHASALPPRNRASAPRPRPTAPRAHRRTRAASRSRAASRAEPRAGMLQRAEPALRKTPRAVTKSAGRP